MENETILDRGLRRVIGQQISHYTVLAKLGEGGMGVVWKARDTRLNRLVALKTLPAERTANAERRARFVQEAQAASALNHPNIITIHDIFEHGGADCIVMEFVDGQPLDQLIPKKGMRLDEALRLAIQIADALGRAHAAGIIHRDLKPGNVMVTREGQVKLLDFGLAKLSESEPVGEDGSTRTRVAQTEEGTVLGTAAYMSPEQAEGRKIEARSDVFSFGAVLYEMVSGHRAFQGASKLSVLSAVVREEPKPLEDAPSELARIIARCLRKDPARRFQTTADLKVALEELKEESDSGKLEATAPPRPRQSRRWLVWLAGAGVAVAAVLVAAWIFFPREGAAPLSLTRFTSDAGLTTDPAISPDGKLIAYASDRAGGKGLDIWVQHRAGGAPIRITSGEMDEREPAFSPDGSQLAYSAGGIYVVSSLGGEPRKLAPSGRRPRFSPDGKQILYCSGGRILTANIWLVDVAGGAPRQLQHGFRWADYPIWSPDGQSILYSGRAEIPGKFGWYLTSPADEPARRLGDIEGQPEQWLPDGTILYASVVGSAGLSNDLFAARLSALGRKPRRLLGGTGIVGPVSVAADGTAAVFMSAATTLNLWSLPLEANSAKVTGEIQPLTQDVAVNAYPSISADGRRLVFVSNIAGNPDIWFLDTATGSRKPITVDPAREFLPVISPDGTQVAFTRGESNGSLWVVSLSDPFSPGTPRKVYDAGSRYVRAWDWSFGNRGLLCTTYPEPPIGLIDVDSGKRSDYLKDAGRSLYQAHLSPDGRWVTVMYPSEIRVAPVRDGKPAGPDEWKIAVKGGADLPRWSPDGNTIYFLSRRDSFRCLYAQRLDPKTKEPAGEPFAVLHLHSARRSLSFIQDSGAIGLALARDRIVIPLGEITGNIWLTQLPARR